jgi:hypothetical protein
MAIDFHDDLLQGRLRRLRAVSWGAAPGGSRQGKQLLFAYYQRLLPVWPAHGGKILPHDASVIAAFTGRLAPAEVAELRTLEEGIVSAARHRHAHVSAAASGLLIILILACSVLVGRGVLAAAADPAEPLLELFEAGYQLSASHGSVDVLDASGATTIPLPTRADVEAGRFPK